MLLALQEVVPEIERIQEGITGRESGERLVKDISQYRVGAAHPREGDKVQKRGGKDERTWALQDLVENSNLTWMKKMKSKEGGEEETRVLQTWVEVEKQGGGGWKEI